jgi:MFS superfamily sulfate permease-like transporter
MHREREASDGAAPRSPGGTLRQDALAGFLVFLIALPLCLGIALACGYPPIAGIFTAIVGGMLAPFISDSQLTIKGPAAGLIVIAIGCITDFGGNGFLDGSWSDADQHALRCALAVGTAAAVAQILFAGLKGGFLGELFPLSAVHGMLAAIGVIIVAKQLPIMLGLEAKGAPFELILAIPEQLVGANPAIALIGGTSLAILLLWPRLRVRALRKVPAPILVVLVAVPLGTALGLPSEEPLAYTFLGKEHEVSRSFLVQLPDTLASGIALPDFSALAQPRAWYWVMMFAVIGTVESLLSAKAVDLLDPEQRRCDLDRDNLAVGSGNLVASLLGGLPMISEIVRSRANIDSGARSRWANFFHGLFLLVAVAALPGLLSRIPLSALAAMLVYTGFRLAHPSELAKTLRIGWEQLLIFGATLIGVLATDLLLGIAIGILTKIVIHVGFGAPVGAIFRPRVEVERNDSELRLRVPGAAVFTTCLPVSRALRDLPAEASVRLDLSGARVVDHTFMEKLHLLERDLGSERVTVEGIGGLEPISRHPLSARRRPSA